MSIQVNASNRLFHLQTKHTSYVFHVIEDGSLGQLYYGPKIPFKDDYANLNTREEHDCTNTRTDEDVEFQAELLKQEYAGLVRATTVIQPSRLPIQTAHGPLNSNTATMSLRTVKRG